MIERYRDHLFGQLQRIADTQADAIRDAGRIVGDALASDGILYGFGGGHAMLSVLDVFSRGGGLVPVSPLLAPGVMLWDWPQTRAGRMEKELDHFGDVLVETSGMTGADVFVIVSTAGSINVAIEAALRAKALGVPVIGLTSVEWSREQTSTHHSGQRLFEVVDLVIDSCGVRNYGAVLPVPGSAQGVGPTSSIAESFILQSIVLEAVMRLTERGVDPPILISGHMPGATEHNTAVRERYRGRLKWF